MPHVSILWCGGVSCPVSVYFDGMGCHVLCLYTVTGWCVMSCVCILCCGGVSCPVSVYCDRVVLCPVSTLWWDGVSCTVSLYCDRVVSFPVSVCCDKVGCHVLCLYTVIGRDVMSCVCILWRMVCLYTVTGWYAMPCVCIQWWDVKACVCILWQLVYYVPCLYTVTWWHIMSCVCILWQGGVSYPVSILWQVSCPVSVYCDRYRYALIGGHLFISLSSCDLYYILYQNSDIKTFYIMVLVQQHWVIT